MVLTRPVLIFHISIVNKWDKCKLNFNRFHFGLLSLNKFHNVHNGTSLTTFYLVQNVQSLCISSDWQRRPQCITIRVLYITVVKESLPKTYNLTSGNLILHFRHMQCKLTYFQKTQIRRKQNTVTTTARLQVPQIKVAFPFLFISLGNIDNFIHFISYRWKFEYL